MPEGKIKLSEKYGVNPTLTLCYFCGEDTGIALLGRLPGDVEAPKYSVLDKSPCEKCADYMEEGIIFLGIQDGWDGKGEPKRTGKFFVIKEDAVRRILDNNEELLYDVLKKRVLFIEDDTIAHLGLNKESN